MIPLSRPIFAGEGLGERATTDVRGLPGAFGNGAGLGAPTCFGEVRRRERESSPRKSVLRTRTSPDVAQSGRIHDGVVVEQAVLDQPSEEGPFDDRPDTNHPEGERFADQPGSGQGGAVPRPYPERQSDRQAVRGATRRPVAAHLDRLPPGQRSPATRLIDAAIRQSKTKTAARRITSRPRFQFRHQRACGSKPTLSPLSSSRERGWG
jgi:hypothetical protein